MQLADLLDGIDTLAVSGSMRVQVQGVANDSRHVRPGFVFVAVRGETADGRSYIEEAVERGAAAVVSDRQELQRKGTTLVTVADARAALGSLCSRLHDHPTRRLKMIGVTGTNGKTTCVYLVRDILEAHGVPTGVIGTVAYVIGARTIPASRTTPDTPDLYDYLGQMAAAGCGAAAMEVSSHALVQRRIEGIDYDVVAFTNLSRDHLDYHGDMETYFQAKERLFLAAGAHRPAVAVIHTDGGWGQRLAARADLRASILTCGTRGGEDLHAGDIHLSASGTRFRLITPWGEGPVESHLMGRFNVANMLVAAGVTGSLGVPIETILRVLHDHRSVRGRLEEVAARDGSKIFVDYAHTDDALDQVLTTLREVTAGRLIVVFGCGGNRDRTKRPNMGEVASRIADVSIITSDNPRREDPAAILADFVQGVSPDATYTVIEDRAQAIREAVRLARDGDTILIAGKGHEEFQEFANRTIPFDDREVVRAALREGQE